MTTRTERILARIDKSGKGLEIGASYNPVAPKSAGWNIEIADHLDKANLCKKYEAWNVDTRAIEEVDHILGDAGLFESINRPSEYDFIIASHVIEHVPDVISFIQDCEKLLKPDGILSLAIPDKRYCFDILKPFSTTGQILQAYIEKRKRHTAGTIYDAHSLHARRGDMIVFPDHGSLEGLSFAHSALEANIIMDQYIKSNTYLDVHAWLFTPASFALVINDLINLGFAKFRVEIQFETLGYEFFMALKRSDTDCADEADRVLLACRAMQEEINAKEQ